MAPNRYYGIKEWAAVKSFWLVEKVKFIISLRDEAKDSFLDKYIFNFKPFAVFVEYEQLFFTF